jgi:hypothetical protein
MATKKLDLKRLTKEDFPSKYFDLLDRLIFPLNSHMEQVRNIINFETQEFTTLSVTTNDSGQPVSVLKFNSGLTERIKGLMVVSARVTSDNTSVLTQAPFITFSQNESVITINYIAGLQPNKRYELTILSVI